MHIEHPNRKSSVVRHLLAVVGPVMLSTSLFAQTAPTSLEEKNKEETLVLSPFVVNTSGDVGYAARNTLAGTRLNAQLKDLPSQINIMTKEFLSDLAALSPEDAYKYSMNVEGLDEYQDQGADNYAGNLSVTSTGRIRSIGIPSKTQNFFPSAILLDNYNTDRITFSSGPNAVIYGIGDPGGIVNTDFIRANPSKNFGKLEYRIDNDGGSRASLDYNWSIVKSKAALRFAVLNGDEKFSYGPGYNDTRRYFGTIELHPFEGTTIYAYGEKAHIDRTPPRGSVIYDAVSPWIKGKRRPGCLLGERAATA